MDMIESSWMQTEPSHMASCTCMCFSWIQKHKILLICHLKKIKNCLITFFICSFVWLYWHIDIDITVKWLILFKCPKSQGLKVWGFSHFNIIIYIIKQYINSAQSYCIIELSVCEPNNIIQIYGLNRCKGYFQNHTNLCRTFVIYLG